MKRQISNLARGMMFILLWTISLCMFAQGITVRGSVVDANNEPLIGVTIQVPGTTIGTVTDADGNFTLSNVPSNGQIEVSYVGMQTQLIPVNGRTTIQVTLSEDTELLEEVVVVGYGTMKKSDLTGAVENVSAARLLDKPAFNVAQALSGKVAGLKIIERSGAPGGIPMIRIRGTNSINSGNDPLFVVDDVVGVTNALTILNPNEI
jgi:hypothetical protein